MVAFQRLSANAHSLKQSDALAMPVRGSAQAWRIGYIENIQAFTPTIIVGGVRTWLTSGMHGMLDAHEPRHRISALCHE